jgi:hypothetical protein
MYDVEDYTCILERGDQISRRDTCIVILQNQYRSNDKRFEPESLWSIYLSLCPSVIIIRYTLELDHRTRIYKQDIAFFPLEITPFPPPPPHLM